MELKLAVIAAIALFAEPVADACAPAPPVGEEVAIADEEAVIVWDAATKTEHFIRRAQFDSTAPSFGFLVPTPTQPQLGEVDDRIFTELSWQLRPNVVVDTSGFTIDPEPLLWKACLLTGRMKGDEGAMPASVEVMQSVNVAGFDATTLRADTPEAISGWLGDHGFATTPQLTEWLGWYVEHHWMITAFVVASKEPESRSVMTSAVRMTFTTDRPFYPYREPARVPITTTPRVQTASRLLRVFFMSSERYAATLGDKPWGARVLHSSRLPLPEALTALKAGTFVTVFHDESNPRVATDELYFAPSTDKAEVHQTVTRYAPKTIPLAPDVWILVAFIVWRRRRRKSRRAAQSVAGTQ